MQSHANDGMNRMEKPVDVPWCECAVKPSNELKPLGPGALLVHQAVLSDLMINSDHLGPVHR
jgi:hypothetical protein